MQDYSVFLVNSNGQAFPNTEAVNSTGPQAQDGTELIKALVDNGIMGWQQPLLDFAGLTPNGAAEILGNSQILDSLKISFGHPGEMVGWFGKDDPATLNLKLLLLHGQGILIADFADLDAAVYVGDAANPTAGAFFRANDAGGAVRNTAGTFLILPDARGLFPRFLDETGLVDPDGVTRLPGEFQDEALQEHSHAIGNSAQAAGNGGGGSILTAGNLPFQDLDNGFVNPLGFGPETRPKNITVKPCIRF